MIKKAYLKLFKKEKIAVLPSIQSSRGYGYAVTNYGRAISFKTKPEEGTFLKLGVTSGYMILSIRSRQKRLTFLMHRLVARHFVKQPSPLYNYVIHLDYDKAENYYKNLRWTTYKECVRHTTLNENMRTSAQKLTPEMVRQIKQLLKDGKTTLKKIATQFGVSDMQIHRIKTGENWGHIKPRR